MRSFLIYCILIFGLALYGYEMFYLGRHVPKSASSQVEVAGTETGEQIDYEKYSLESLAMDTVEPGKLEIDSENQVFSFEFDPGVNTDNFKTTTGAINIPGGDGPFPIILMIRGYVDQEIYKTGVGTSSAAEVLAENGYITVAPDFLGYAQSDSESESVLETRFQTYVTILSLLKSLDQIEVWDGKNLGIWAHSNGGQIALTTLAVTGRAIPTTLWAPVTRPFPYNILYYTDESEDEGRFIRQELGKFEKEYDAREYSFTTYLRGITAVMQIHQGTNDDAVPLNWSEEFSRALDEASVENELYIYSGADHNMRPKWDEVMAQDLEFFKVNLVD